MIDLVEFAIVADQGGFTPEQVKDLWAQGNVERTLVDAEAKAREQRLTEEVIHETLITTLRETLRVMQIETLAQAWSLGKANRIDKSRQFVRVAIRDGGLRCRYCDLDLYAYDTYNALDHVIPRKPLKKDKAAWAMALGRKGGGIEDDDNVVLACRDCNHLKGRYLPEGTDTERVVADAEREVSERRAARINGGLRGLLDRLIEGRGPR